MSKNRYINTKFWDDSYVSELDPTEKLLFIYLLTNSLTNIAGVYEIPLKRIAFDVGIEKDMVKKIIERFREDKKMCYINGWIIICNFTKHQKINPKIEKGIEHILSSLPTPIKEAYDSLSKPINSLSKPLNYSNSNSNSNSNTNKKKDYTTRKKYGIFKTVPLKDKELEHLIKKYGKKNTEDYIEKLDYYVGVKGGKYKSHYRALIAWMERDKVAGRVGGRVVKYG